MKKQSIYIFIVPVSHNAASRTTHLRQRWWRCAVFEGQMPSFLRSSLPQVFWGNEDRSIHFIYQCECKSWGADSPIGQKSSCEEYTPHTTKCILGGIFFTISHLLVHSTVFWQCGFGLGHPNQMFHFPLPSTQKVGSVSRIKKKSKNNFKVIQFL